MNCTYHYYYDGQRMVQTQNGSGYGIANYVWGARYVDELVEVQTGGASYFALTDRNFNVAGLVDGDPAVVHFRVRLGGPSCWAVIARGILRETAEFAD